MAKIERATPLQDCGICLRAVSSCFAPVNAQNLQCHALEVLYCSTHRYIKYGVLAIQQAVIVLELDLVRPQVTCFVTYALDFDEVTVHQILGNQVIAIHHRVGD